MTESRQNPSAMPDMPKGFGASAPDIWLDMAEEERKTGCILDEETCVIKGVYFFLKGNLDIPFKDSKEFFTYTVWVSLNKEHFERIVSLWGNPLRSKEPPYFAWLATRLPSYPETINLKTQVYINDIGMRPTVILEPNDHPLAVEQRQGMDRTRIEEIVTLLNSTEGDL
ncbi:MAG: DUF2199 domain-containing protein [Chloroflexota bacterium]